MRRAIPIVGSILVAVSLATAGCGGGSQSSGQRGLGSKSPLKNKKKGDKGKGGAKGGGGEGEEGGAPERPDRPKIVITRDNFGPLSRDPFKTPFGTGDQDIVDVDAPREKQRDVRMAEYNFEDLKLIGVVLSSRNIQPRALFLATDGKSKTVRQGEFFSRAEVMLAAVNRDYIEIEVVDEELARGLNMTRGERRAIYLKND
jgi:hypothetical protein